MMQLLEYAKYEKTTNLTICVLLGRRSRNVLDAQFSHLLAGVREAAGQKSLLKLSKSATDTKSAFRRQRGMEAVAGVPFRAMLPLFGVGVLTLLLTLCFCCYLWRLKRQGQRDTGYIVIKYKKKYSKKNSTELAVLQPEGGSVCPVCLDEFSEGDKVAVTLPCRHSFHCKCLSQWLANSACCPMCKTLLRLHDNDHTHLVTELVVAG